MTPRFPPGLAVLVAIPVLPPALYVAVAPPGPFWNRLSVLTGLMALCALVAAAVLPSRIRTLNRLLGIETVLDAHRVLGVTAAALVLAHLACVVAADPARLVLLDPGTAPDRARAATGATVALLALVGSALARRYLPLRYETWRWVHVGLAGAVLVLTAAHVWLLDHLVRDGVLGTVLLLGGALVVGVAVHRWVWRPLLDPGAEFVVREVRPESPTVSTLVLEARHGRHSSTGPWAFAPGQFAWLRLRRSPGAEEHPFTIASSAHLDATEFTVRHSGDFTRALRTLPPGSPVWVDGPHGAFTSDIGPCGGFVMIAGGVGVTPMMSMLRTAADRGDRRPHRLVVVGRAPDELLFRDELAGLRERLDLEVTEVLRRPRPGWTGHTGEVDLGLLRLALAGLEHSGELDWFVCGPPRLVGDALDVVDALGVPPARVHTELFDPV